jgi:hypothetical protein
MGMGVRASLGVAAACVLAASTAFGDAYIIDSHTAMVPAHGELRLMVGAGPEGMVMTSANLGLVDRVSVGLSYGMGEVLGRGAIEPNPRPGVQLHVLLVDVQNFPAVGIGFDSQGHGRWLEGYDRYERKSPGFYGVVTQNLLVTSYELLSSITGGVNFSAEPNRQNVDFFMGATQSFGRGLSVLLDYDFNLDDDAGIDANRGYLDLGFQWRFGSGNHLRFLLRDLLGNYEGQGNVARELNFFYLVHL